MPSPPRESGDSDEDVGDGASARFTSLTKALLGVPLADVKAEERRRQQIRKDTKEARQSASSEGAGAPSEGGSASASGTDQ